jgi:hypothetical protein
VTRTRPDGQRARVQTGARQATGGCLSGLRSLKPHRDPNLRTARIARQRPLLWLLAMLHQGLPCGYSPGFSSRLYNRPTLDVGRVQNLSHFLFSGLVWSSSALSKQLHC